MHDLCARLAAYAKLPLSTSLPQILRHHLAHPLGGQTTEGTAARQRAKLTIRLPHGNQPAAQVGLHSVVGGFPQQQPRKDHPSRP